MFIKLALTLFFKRQQHRKLSWLDNLMKFQLNTCYILTTYSSPNIENSPTGVE
jgi:hypothetical protein